MSAGRVTSHIGTDPINMQMFLVMFHVIWVAPLQVGTGVGQGRLFGCAGLGMPCDLTTLLGKFSYLN